MHAFILPSMHMQSYQPRSMSVSVHACIALQPPLCPLSACVCSVSAGRRPGDGPRGDPLHVLRALHVPQAHSPDLTTRHCPLRRPTRPSGTSIHVGHSACCHTSTDCDNGTAARLLILTQRPMQQQTHRRTHKAYDKAQPKPSPKCKPMQSTKNTPPPPHTHTATRENMADAGWPLCTDTCQAFPCRSKAMTIHMQAQHRYHITHTSHKPFMQQETPLLYIPMPCDASTRCSSNDWFALPCKCAISRTRSLRCPYFGRWIWASLLDYTRCWVCCTPMPCIRWSARMWPMLWHVQRLLEVRAGLRGPVPATFGCKEDGPRGRVAPCCVVSPRNMCSMAGTMPVCVC